MLQAFEIPSAFIAFTSGVQMPGLGESAWLLSSLAVCKCRAMQAICAEAWGSDSTSAAKALGLMSLGWTMGSTLGPAFGGALSEPCAMFGPAFFLCEPGQLFQARSGMILCPCVPHRNVLCLKTVPRQPTVVCSRYSDVWPRSNGGVGGAS